MMATISRITAVGRLSGNKQEIEETPGNQFAGTATSRNRLRAVWNAEGISVRNGEKSIPGKSFLSPWLAKSEGNAPLGDGDVLNKDNKLKAERGYTDPKSFVRLDGSEVLHKADWKRRKEQLWFRCGGQCEYRYPNGARCRGDCNDPHHSPRPRWPVRDDRLENLVGMCREHHKLVDQRKIGGRHEAHTRA